MISKQEFLNFVKSFNKNPNEYTEEEIYQIGLKHRELPLQDRSWKMVASLVGWTKDAETLRGFIRRRLLSEGNLPINQTLLSSRSIETISNDDLVEQKQELMVQQQKTRDEWTAYRKLLRDNSRVEVFIDELKNEIRKMPKLDVINYKGPILSKSEMVVCLSDLHLGAEFENGYNKYNKDIAIERLNKFTNEIIGYCKQLNIYKLHFLNLGDLIQGIIHPTLRLEQDLDIVNQIITSSELVCNMLVEIKKYVPELTYRSVTDNHSRSMVNKVENIEAENFNRLVDYYIETRLGNSKISFPKDNISVEVGSFKLDNGKLVMFSHGHEDKKTSVFQDFVGLSRQVPDYIFMGHYHNAAEHTFQNCKVYINGSVMGTDLYAYSHRLFSKPSQKLVIFDRENVIDINVML